MSDKAWILGEGLAGLQAQALGLAEAAGLLPQQRILEPRWPWRHVTARLWPMPLKAVNLRPKAGPDLIISCGGTGGVVGAALRPYGHRVVQVQNPRIPIDKFDLIIANRHDELTGPNVFVIRTALHRVTDERLAQEAAIWRDRLAHLPRPLVCVLVGGSNGRFKLGAAEGAALAGQLAKMMRDQSVGVAVTPSRRTDPAVTASLKAALEPLGGYVWDGHGQNPYFGLLALADMIVVTIDSVSMASEAAATGAPVMLAPLPGKSRRIKMFADGLIQDGRARLFEGRYAHWPVQKMNDTLLAAAEMNRRLGRG